MIGVNIYMIDRMFWSFFPMRTTPRKTVVDRLTSRHLVNSYRECDPDRTSSKWIDSSLWIAIESCPTVFVTELAIVNDNPGLDKHLSNLQEAPRPVVVRLRRGILSLEHFALFLSSTVVIFTFSSFFFLLCPIFLVSLTVFDSLRTMDGLAVEKIRAELSRILGP